MSGVTAVSPTASAKSRMASESLIRRSAGTRSTTRAIAWRRCSSNDSTNCLPLSDSRILAASQQPGAYQAFASTSRVGGMHTHPLRHGTHVERTVSVDDDQRAPLRQGDRDIGLGEGLGHDGNHRPRRLHHGVDVLVTLGRFDSRHRKIMPELHVSVTGSRCPEGKP